MREAPQGRSGVAETMEWVDRSNLELSYDSFVISIKAEKSYAQVDVTEK